MKKYIQMSLNNKMSLDNIQIKVMGDFLMNYENDLINIIQFKKIIDN